MPRRFAIKNVRWFWLRLAFLLPIGVAMVVDGFGGHEALAGPRDAHPHPDFSGTWSLDSKRSDFGPMPLPSRMTDTVEQTATGLSISRTLANDDHESNFQFGYLFDGTEVVNKTQNNQTHSRAHWEGDALVVDTRVDVEGLPLRIQDRWTLRSDCGCLQILRHLHSQQGDMRLRMVMIRK